MLLSSNDPLDDIGNTRKISSVVFNGTLYPRHALDAMIARIETLASRKCLSDVLNPTIKEKGAEAVVQQYRELKSTHRDAYDFDDKYELSSISRSLLREKKFEDAICICELNLEEFPRSWWAYEDLAEAYQRAGKKGIGCHQLQEVIGTGSGESERGAEAQAIECTLNPASVCLRQHTPAQPRPCERRERTGRAHGV